MRGKTIETGVDSLIILVKKRKRISIKEAAEKLNVNFSTVSDWASFLEEEGIINIEYKFTTPYLVRRKPTPKEAEELKRSIEEGESIFDRESEGALNYLNKLEIEVDSLKELFEHPKEEFSDKLPAVKKEFEKIKEIKKEREKIEKEMTESQISFNKKNDDMNKQTFKEYMNCRAAYDIFDTQSMIEGEILAIQEEEIELIKEAEDMIDKELEELGKMINKNERSRKKSKKIRSRKRDKKISKTESKLRSIKEKHQKLRWYLKDHKNIMDKLLKINQEQREQMKSLRGKSLSKIKMIDVDIDNKIKELKNDIPAKLRLFISKKDEILKTLNNISNNEKTLKKEILDLKKRKSALSSAGTSKNILKEIKKLQESLEEISSKKGFFETEIKKIFGLLKR